MFTPQQIEQVTFGRATFGGYDMQAVDEFLEPLLEDYVTLYKENALLKSKMKLLVSRLEEYRNDEANMKDSIANTQATCDQMIKDAEAKCAQMIKDANTSAIENAKNADALVAAENARVEDARKTAAAKIAEIQDQIRACLTALDRIKDAHRPTSQSSSAFDYDRIEGTKDEAMDVADEISANVEALVGPADDTAPKAAPKHPVSETTVNKFADLRFGPNYDSTKH